MTLRTLSGAPLSRLGIGASRVGSIGNAVPMAEIRRMLDYAIEAGINVFDTADIYGQGDSERELGRAVRGRRDACFVVTKVGQRFSLAARMVRPIKPLLKALARRSGSARKGVIARRSGVIGKNFEAAYLRGALEASRRRLRLDQIDAVLLHGPSRAVLEDGGALDALLEARERGLVRHVGVSCDEAFDARWSLQSGRCEAVQLPVDLLSSAMTEDFGPAFAARSVGVLAREVLRFHPDLTPVEAVLRYALRDDVTSTIVGVSTVVHLAEIHDAFAAAPEPRSGERIA